MRQFETRGVDLVFPPEGDESSSILLLLAGASVVGSLPAEKKARDEAAAKVLQGVKEDLLKASSDAADLRTETLTIFAKHHRHIIGPNGSVLNALIGEDRAVSVKVGPPKAGDKAAQAKGAPPIGEDSVVVRGPSAEVDRVVKEIQRIAEDAEQDAIVNGHVVEFQVDSTHIPHLVGRSGAAVTKLRNDLGVRVDFGEQDETRKKGSKTKITLTGRKESVEEAKKRLLSQTEKLADETTTTIKIPAHLHASMIGQGGKYVSRLQDTYAVRINFPRDAAAANGENGRARTEQKPDEVIIKGGKKGVEQAKQELVELLAYEQENNNVAEVPVSSKAIPRILGKAGANVNQLREDTGAQVDVDRDDDDKDVTTIRLRGTKQAIASAKSAILAIAKEVDAEASYTLHIDPAFHGQLIGPAGAAIRDLIIRCGGPSDAKASSQFVLFPRRGDKAADIVTVRGPADIANKIKTELEAASKALADRIVYGVAIAPSAQSGLVGRGGSRQRELQAKHNVVMILPGWKEYDLIAEPVNNAELGAASANSIIKILGAQEACEALAKEITVSRVTSCWQNDFFSSLFAFLFFIIASIQSSFASVSKTVPVPRAVHTKLATPQFFRQLRNDFGVAVDTPRGGATANGASRPAVSSAAAAARIDADESAEDGLSWELEKLDLSGESPVEWTLTGKDEAALEKAERKIAIAVQKAGEFSHEGRLLVDRAVVPRIIGRGGAGLSAIQQDTGASVEIPRESGGLCIIRGSEEAVLAAKDRLVRIATSPARPRD